MDLGKVVELRVKNYKCITEEVLEPEELTVLAGENAQGKSAFLEAIHSLLEGIGDDEVRRGAEEEAEIVLRTEKYELKRTERGLEIRDLEDEFKVPKPVTVLKDLAGEGLNFDPVQFAAAESKQERRERRDALLRAAGVELSVEDLDLKSTAAEKVDTEGMEPMEIIEEVEDTAYSWRREVNSMVDELESDTELIEESIENPDMEFSESKLEEAEQQLAEMEDARDAYQNARGKIESKEERVEEIDAEIERLKSERQDLLDQISGIKSELPDFDEEAYKRAKHQVELLKQAREDQSRQKRLAEKREKLERKQQQSQQLTHDIDYLRDEAPRELAEQIDIEGFDFEIGDDAELYVDTGDGPVNIDTMSSSERLLVGVQVARKLAGDLGFICIDNFEVLDPEHRREFAEMVEGDGYTYFIARVGDPEPGDYEVRDGSLSKVRAEGEEEQPLAGQGQIGV